MSPAAKREELVRRAASVQADPHLRAARQECGHEGIPEPLDAKLARMRLVRDRDAAKEK